MGLVGMKRSYSVADLQWLGWLLAPVWVCLGASLSPEWRGPPAAVLMGASRVVGWVGEVALRGVVLLPADWPLVAEASSWSPLLVGAVVSPPAVWMAVQVAVRFRRGSGVLG